MTQFEFNKDAALRNLKLRILEYAVQDGQFIRSFGEIARLIGASERACDKAASRDRADADYIEAVCEEEIENIEELIGVSFLILQIKISRVKSAASWAFKDDLEIFNVCGMYGSHEYSMIEFIWEIANYYKHRDEVSGSRGKKRRVVIDSLGLVAGSTGNLRTALEKLGVSPYSNCEKIALHVQCWAEHVFRAAKAAAGGAPISH